MFVCMLFNLVVQIILKEREEKKKAREGETVETDRDDEICQDEENRWVMGLDTQRFVFVVGFGFYWNAFQMCYFKGHSNDISGFMEHMISQDLLGHVTL